MPALLPTLLLLAAPQGAPDPVLLPAGPLRHGVYDFETGFTEVPGHSNRAAGPDVLFDSTGCVAYYYLATGVPPGQQKQEWLDDAGLPTRGVSGEEEIRGMTWRYCNMGVAGGFDAVVSIYDNTDVCIGPSQWVPGLPSFADCLYGVSGLPDGGCWSVTVDLTGGAECVVPQTGPAGAAYLGWSVVPDSPEAFQGPELVPNYSCIGYGTANSSFEWRDWNGAYFGTPYYYSGCYWSSVPLDFQMQWTGAPEDTQSAYGRFRGPGGLDSLVLEARTNAEPGAAWDLQLTVPTATAASYAWVISAGGPVDAPMTNAHGSWTRKVGAQRLASGRFTGTGPLIGFSIPIPANAPPDAQCTLQVVEIAGPVGPANVVRASNGVVTYL